MKRFENKLKKHFNEVFLVEPNNLGANWMTNTYKNMTSFLKQMPFSVIIPLSLLFVLFLYLLFDKALLVKLTSLLQYGF